MGLFNSGDLLSAGDLNALNGYVLKTADQSVTSSTTLVNDSELSFAIPAAGTYIVDLFLYGVSAADAAGHIQVGFSFPTGTLHFSAMGPTSVASGSVGSGDFRALLSATSGTTAWPYSLSTAPMVIHVHAILTATATGTLRLMWAQGTSSASASTLKAGSHMLVRQVA